MNEGYSCGNAAIIAIMYNLKQKIMKKIINGKKYDTGTATEVCYGLFGGGLKSVTLYQKKNGEFFEHHEDRNNRREWIEPVDEQEAKRFAEEQMTGEEYEEYFGEVEE